MEIQVYSNEVSACNVADHFKDNWIDFKGLHPKAKACVVDVRKNSDFDAIYLVGEDNHILLKLEGSEALRLDYLQEFIINQT